MKITGTINQIMIELIRSALDQEKTFVCDIKEQKKKRSLDANSYYWSLLHRYAEWSRRSDIWIHNDILSRFGQPQTENGRNLTLWMLDSVEWHELPYIHVRPTSETVMSREDFKTYRAYVVMRGSHEYDTKEFSRLVDGLIQDIQGSDAPIETMTPAELAVLKGYIA